MYWVYLVIEWVHFVLRHSRDVELGQHVDKLMQKVQDYHPQASRVYRQAQRARRFISYMADEDHRKRHEATLIRIGH